MTIEMAANSSGAMLAVTVPNDVKARLAIPGGEPSDQLHITLFYFYEDADLNDDQRTTILRLAQSLAAEYEPFDVALRGTEVFEENEERPLIVNVVSPILEDYRKRLAVALDLANIGYSKEHEYKPHITLKYLNEEPRPSVEVNEIFTARMVEAWFANRHVPITFGKPFFVRKIPRHGFHGRRVRNNLKVSDRHSVGDWPAVGVHDHAEPTSPRTYEDVVDYFHNYEHDPEGLNHCVGSEANSYVIIHVQIRSGIQHKISLSYARGHGEGNKEQWFRFPEYLEDGYHLEAGESIPEPPREKWNVRETRYLSTRKARRTQFPGFRQMARPKAGQKQRIGSGDWETRTNRQQRKLVRVYDEWSAALKRELARRVKEGNTNTELQTFLDAQIPKLEARLVEIQSAGIRNAVKTAAGSRAELPAVLARADQQIRENVELIQKNLVPHIHEKLTLALALAIPIVGVGIGGLAVEQQRAVALAIKNATLAGRSAPAQYAGGYWVAIFETEKTLGGIREDERSAQGLPPEPVRWDLDPRAEHCHPSSGFYGCPELAGEYPAGWRSLPTVPAGQVTCRGNCRCHIKVFRDGQWRRGVYDD